jgi:4-oxalocrotonate tautomerase
MPIIRVELLKGRSIEQKREFADVVTRETARILKCSPDVVDVIFSDTEPENWANGGRLAVDKQARS